MKIIAFAIALFVGLYTILVLITTSYYGNEQGNSLVLNRPITHTLRGSLLDCAGINAFYRAMLCIRGTSHGPVSVRPSVCLSVCPSQVGVLLKRLNVGSHNTTRYRKDSSFLLPKISAKFDRDHPLRGRRLQVGGSKSATFDQ